MREDQKLLEGYQRDRIMAWLNPSQYADKAYQQQNSIMAIGSGQLTGKGLNNDAVASVKNADYIVEPQTDFIFAVAGEELGFIGTAAIILLLLLIVIEIIMIGRNAKDLAGNLICCGVAAWIGFQSFINICVATGLMPNTGVPLPFVSYGLTSLASLYIPIGIVLNVGLQPRKY
jgi:rod shape determining protein RodA